MEIKSGELFECPYCGAPDEKLQCEDIDPETWQREVLCLECNRNWKENGTIVGVEIPEEYEAVYKERQQLKLMSSNKYREHIFNPQPKPESKKKGR
jgi:tRNA G37 N-methylase Trm5